jgi:hypothetical protein
MRNCVSRHTVEDNLGRGGGEDDAHPFAKQLADAQVLEDSEEERPRHGVKSLRDIYLQQQGGDPTGVQCSSRQLHHFEVVVDGATLDKCRLIDSDQLGETRREADRK